MKCISLIWNEDERIYEICGKDAVAILDGGSVCEDCLNEHQAK